MSFSDILFLYRARLGAKAVLVQEGFAVLGIAVGVALLFASQVASTSLVRSVRQLETQVIGNTRQYQLDARGPNGSDGRVLDQVQRMPGVQSALPVLEQPANLVGPKGQQSVEILGTDPHFARAGGPLLRRFSAAQLAAQRAIALPAPLAQSIGVGPLETVELQIGARMIPVLLGATLGEADIGGLVHSPVAITAVAYAQDLAGLKGRVTRIFVRPQPGREREVHGELGRLAATARVNLEPANFDSRLFGLAVSPESKSEALFSAISALVGFMFALNAMLLTVPSRRALIEDIRPQGATQAMIIEILLFDAAVIGVLASVIGLALGNVLSVAVFHATPGYLSFAFPVGNDRIVTWQSVALAVGVGLAAAVVGVLWPLRSAIAHPLDAGDTTQSMWRGWPATRHTIGFLCLVATAVVLIVYPSAAILGNVALLVGLVCLLPSIFDTLVVLFDRLQERISDGAATTLAATELRTPQTRVRSLAIAATAAIAVFGMVEFQGTQANLQRGLDASARGIDSSADVWVTPKGESNAFATTPFRTVGLPAIAHLPGVDTFGLYRGSFLNWGERRLWILAQPSSTREPIPPSELIGGSLAVATARIRQGGWAVISQGLAVEHKLHVGQAFTLPAPRPVNLRVAALSTNLGWPPGAIILNSRDYATAWASTEPSAYQIETKPGAPPSAVRRLVQRVLGPQTGLVVETVSEREQRHYALASQGLSRLTQIRLLLLIATVLAVTGAMGAMLWQRRDLIAFMKVDGYRRGVLWRWLLCESAVLLIAGCLIGSVFGLLGQLLGSHFLVSVTGFPITFTVETVAALSSFALVTIAAMAVVALPGYLVVRTPPSTVSPAY